MVDLAPPTTPNEVDKVNLGSGKILPPRLTPQENGK